jgi:dihydroorotate dehydrogenase
MSLDFLLFKDFALNNPIWIASSHLTESVNSIENWQKIAPAALTLKTTSKFGGTGEGNRYIYPLKEKDSLYCDGEKSKEFLNYTTSKELLHVAKSILPNTKIGTSILMEEEYDKCFASLKESDFFELNLKYSVRTNKSHDIHSKFELDKEQFSNILKQITMFLDIFAAYPCFIKLTREINWLRDCEEFRDFVELIKRYPRVGIIVANTKKYVVPSSATGLSSELEGGILAGSALFDETYKIIKEIKNIVPPEIPIIATGGLDKIESLIDIFKIGAMAVQICTAFQLHGFSYYKTIIRQLNFIQKQFRTKSFDEFIDKVRLGNILFLPPQFTYHPSFYEYNDFGQLFNSQNLDIFLVYGRTFTRRNLEGFIKRFGYPSMETRIITMSPNSPCLEATSKSLGREMGDMHDKIIEAQKNWIQLYHEHGDKRHKLEIYQHNKVPFHSGYLTEDFALFVPYSMLGEGQTLPIYEFDSSSAEYKRLRREFENLIKESEDVFMSTKADNF